MKITVGPITLSWHEGHLYVTAWQKSWELDEAYESCIRYRDGRSIAFSAFQKSEAVPYQSGTFEGFYVDYKSAPESKLELRTFYLIDTTTCELMLRLVTLKEDDNIEEIRWPAPFKTTDGYCVLPLRQGLVLEHDETEVLTMPFNGQFCSAAAYLSMLGLVEKDGSVMMIAETPWDTRYEVMQLFAQKENRVWFCHLPSLGKMAYRRDLRFVFFEAGADYNMLARYYRHYAKERGMVRTLAEKAEVLPQIKALIQSSFVHMGIKTYVQKASRFYDPENPEKNNHMTPFAVRTKEMQDYHDMGMKHLYLHLDGWGIAYDNGHPDVMPINEEAGGVKGMKQLETTMHELGYLFGIHDQYRDFYHLAKSYDIEFAVQDRDGKHYEHANWAGGVQNYLCASIAKDYVRRNFTALKEQGIQLDGAYLDVFTCNEPDECSNPNHPLTRRGCIEERASCFNYLEANHIMSSSEEMAEWAIPSIVFCHYAPYECQMHENGRFAGKGIPLFNLVYHDCVVIPWMMDCPSDDYMLYALLNGGAPYFRRDAAYPNIDGAFTHGVLSPQEQKERCEIVSAFHEKVAGKEMLAHHFLDKKGRRQKTIFSDGSQVIIDLDQGTYELITK